jgi:hypothetical protein
LRLPAKLANKLHMAGESGMGYLLFTLSLKSGEKLVYVTGNYLFDFLDLPDGVTSNDIADVVPHEGREQACTGYRKDAAAPILDFVPFGAEAPLWGRGPGLQNH